MALSLPAKLLALSLLIWVLSLTCEGAIPKCCVATSKAMSPSLLRRMERIEVQSSAGVCNINALIVHVKGKKYCVHVAARNILNRVLKRRRGKRRRKLLRGHLKRARRQATGCRSYATCPRAEASPTPVFALHLDPR
ncbi:hypothetical protein COCON_G00152850 [Conger conger]|uniref:Chemokine interleukin-8-like domain-containing protein n=1 Tax=Conger conger TaxID=82655 RepID=A0A9Q1D8J6_CONCO|nr:hypothetical protein COCON_G00152850 [Conger conger]